MTKINEIISAHKKNDFHNLNRDLNHVLENRDAMPWSLSFSQRLFLSFFAADSDHLKVLEKAFPNHYHCFLSYKNPRYFLEK